MVGHGPPRPKGVEVMEGGRGSVPLLWDPTGLQRPSKVLELTGRVELSVQLPSLQTSLHLRPTNLVDGEGEQPCLQDPCTLGDLSWPFEVGSLELEGFLVEVELGTSELMCWSCAPSHGGCCPYHLSAWPWVTRQVGWESQPLVGTASSPWAALPAGRKELAVWGSCPDTGPGVSPAT